MDPCTSFIASFCYSNGSNLASLLALIVFIIALTNEGQRYFYLIFNLLVILAHVSSVTLVLLSAFFTSGGGAPINRSRNRSRGSKATQETPGNGFLPREIETEGGHMISVSEQLETREFLSEETTIQQSGPSL